MINVYVINDVTGNKKSMPLFIPGGHNSAIRQFKSFLDSQLKTFGDLMSSYEFIKIGFYSEESMVFTQGETPFLLALGCLHSSDEYSTFLEKATCLPKLKFYVFEAEKQVDLFDEDSFEKGLVKGVYNTEGDAN